jgi:hypothetical protein
LVVSSVIIKMEPAKEEGLVDEDDDPTLKIDCPHLPSATYRVEFAGIKLSKECYTCKDESCNSICLTCRGVYCITTHLEEHVTEEEHPLTFSLSDLTVYCHVCKAEVSGHSLEGVFSHFADQQLDGL